MHLQSRVSALLHLSPPVLSAYVDVNPGNPRNQSTPRGYMTWLKAAGQAVAKQLPASARKHFRRQLRRIEEYLRRVRPRSRSLVVFAGPQVWEAIPLQVEVAEELHWGKPSLKHMAWLLDEHRPRGAVVIDGSGARFLRFWMGTVDQDLNLPFSLDVSSWRKPHLVGPSTPGVSKQYGVHRDRVDSRTAEQRSRFLKQLVPRIVDWSIDGQISPVVLVGEADEIDTVLNGVPADFRTQIASLPKLLPQIAESELGKRLRPLLNRWEREYENAIVKELVSEQHSRPAVTGLDRTLDRLQRGQARELVVARGFTGSVQQCTNCGWIDSSDDSVCPICSSKRQPRTLRTVLPELAGSLSVPIEVVAGDAAKKLRAAGGIGAWLRTGRTRSFQKTNVPLLSRAG